MLWAFLTQLVSNGAMRIGVIADTHGLLRPEAEECLAGVNHIIHAGDIGSPEILPRLRAIAPTTAIKGSLSSSIHSARRWVSICSKPAWRR